ncbi:hypothetical protein GCK72_016800 [Caenorhabditis remanei]|uniref:Uncharacterized protein n=1 Tax=Caenorhabditis remanei TaxID=31234 RepID=A0A6A5G625_CAERE|nr:hypothetical protein GCK72_016800 [Caenorhabditis remanei]KAF1750253.1 hypothetical protein GCK72_016800 [Caenorhabditis remanei]
MRLGVSSTPTKGTRTKFAKSEILLREVYARVFIGTTPDQWLVFCSMRLGVSSTPTKGTRTKFAKSEILLREVYARVFIGTTPDQWLVYCSMRLGVSSTPTKGTRTKFAKSEILLREVYARVFIGTTPDQWLVFCSMRLGVSSTPTKGTRTKFAKSEILLREVYARVFIGTTPDQWLVFCSMRLGVSSTRTKDTRTEFAKSEILLREVYARVFIGTTPDQWLVFCSMRLGVSSTRTKGTRTKFAKSEILLREVYARVFIGTTPDQWLVFCSMRLGVSSTPTKGTRTKFAKNDSGSVACLLFHAFRSKFYAHKRYANRVRKVGDPLTGGLRTRVHRNDSGSVASLLFHAFRSKFYAHKRYANQVRKVGDPLTGGLRTRVHRNDSGSVACLLFHAFRSKFYAHKRYANRVRKVGDPLTGGLRTRVHRNYSGSVACLLFHAFRNLTLETGKPWICLMMQTKTIATEMDTDYLPDPSSPFQLFLAASRSEDPSFSLKNLKDSMRRRQQYGEVTVGKIQEHMHMEQWVEMEKRNAETELRWYKSAHDCSMSTKIAYLSACIIFGAISCQLAYNLYIGPELSDELGAVLFFIIYLPLFANLFSTMKAPIQGFDPLYNRYCNSMNVSQLEQRQLELIDRYLNEVLPMKAEIPATRYRHDVLAMIIAGEWIFYASFRFCYSIFHLSYNWSNEKIRRFDIIDAGISGVVFLSLSGWLIDFLNSWHFAKQTKMKLKTFIDC